MEVGAERRGRNRAIPDRACSGCEADAHQSTGLNNAGIDVLVEKCGARYRGVLNQHGKNFDTPTSAADDYVACLRKVHAHASFVTANISRPTPPRALQRSDGLDGSSPPSPQNDQLAGAEARSSRSRSRRISTMLRSRRSQTGSLRAASTQ
jgi:hypothetical protein